MVDVEQGDALQQLTCPLHEGLPHRLGGGCLVDNQRHILLGQREPGEQPDAGNLSLGRQQGTEVQLYRAGPGGQPESLDHLGMQLARVTDDLSLEQELSAPPRMPGRGICVAAFEHMPRRLGDGFGEGDHMPPVSCNCRPIPACGMPGSGDNPGEKLRLLGQGGLQRCELLVAWTLGHAGAGGGRRAAIAVDETTLEQRQVRQGTGGVLDNRREQPWKQRGAKIRAGLGQGIRQPHHRPARIVLRQPQTVQIGIGDERQAEHLGESGSGGGTQGGAPGTLGSCQAPAGGRRRKPAADPVVADLASDFLHDVIGIPQIGTPGRSLDRKGVAERRD